MIRRRRRGLLGGITWFLSAALELDNTLPEMVAQYDQNRYAVGGIPKTFAELHTFTRSTSATYEDASGIIQTAAINEARFNYKNGVALGLLLETAATNLEPNSANGLNSTITVVTGDNTISMTGSGSLAVAANTAIGTGWGTATDGAPLTINVTAGGNIDLTVTGSVDTKQVEAGASATSYIPTAGAAVTRAVDVCKMDGAIFSSFWNAASGTLYVEQELNFNEAWAGIIQAHDAGTAERIGILQSSTAKEWFNMRDNNVTLMDRGNSTDIMNALHKEALAYELNNSVGAVNGTTGAADLAVTIPTVDRLSLFASVGGARSDGVVKEVRYYNFRGTDAGLGSITI